MFVPGDYVPYEVNLDGAVCPVCGCPLMVVGGLAWCPLHEYGRSGPVVPVKSTPRGAVEAWRLRREGRVSNPPVQQEA